MDSILLLLLQMQQLELNQELKLSYLAPNNLNCFAHTKQIFQTCCNMSRSIQHSMQVVQFGGKKRVYCYHSQLMLKQVNPWGQKNQLRHFGLAWLAAAAAAAASDQVLAKPKNRSSGCWEDSLVYISCRDSKQVKRYR